jgi:hypothetical protein
VKIVRLRRFQTARNLAEPGIIHNVTKGLAANPALSDMLVPIHARAKVGLRIVEVKGDDLLKPDERFDFLDGRVPPFGGSDIEPRGKQMARVETDSEAFRLIDFIVNGRKVLNCASKATALARCVLQSDADWRHFRRAKYFIKSSNDLLQAGRFTLAKMRAGVHDKEGQSQIRREPDFLHKRLQGFVAVVAWRSAKVDQITRVTENGGNLLGRQLICI